MMEMNLDGRAAIVTGAGRGLGLAAATALLDEGCQVVAAARSHDELDRLAERWPRQVVAQPCDMTDHKAVATLPDRALSAFGRLDVVVNNAGIAPASRFLDQEWDVWNQVFSVNVTALAVLSQAAGSHMLVNGEGSIVNVASTTGLRGKAWLAAYSSSKGAVLRLSESLAAEWAEAGVRVNAIAPGAFETQAQRAVMEDADLLRRRIRKIPTGRMGTPKELGGLVAYLASPMSSFVTGATFVIDGGESSRL